MSSPFLQCEMYIFLIINFYRHKLFYNVFFPAAELKDFRVLNASDNTRFKNKIENNLTREGALCQSEWVKINSC